jgi:hypothetical protein
MIHDVIAQMRRDPRDTVAAALTLALCLVVAIAAIIALSLHGLG